MILLTAAEMSLVCAVLMESKCYLLSMLSGNVICLSVVYTVGPFPSSASRNFGEGWAGARNMNALRGGHLFITSSAGAELGGPLRPAPTPNFEVQIFTATATLLYDGDKLSLAPPLTQILDPHLSYHRPER